MGDPQETCNHGYFSALFFWDNAVHCLNRQLNLKRAWRASASLIAFRLLCLTTLYDQDILDVCIPSGRMGNGEEERGMESEHGFEKLKTKELDKVFSLPGSWRTFLCS